jgi:hypothetical protein
MFLVVPPQRGEISGNRDTVWRACEPPKIGYTYLSLATARDYNLSRTARLWTSVGRTGNIVRTVGELVGVRCEANEATGA